MRSLLFAFALCSSACSAPPCRLGADIDNGTCATLTAMALPEALPERPTNPVADDRAAAVLGFQIFFDARFSGTHDVRCASCHAPETYFDDHLPVAKAIGTGTRNAPSALNAARLSHIFWDGRADVLWVQPIAAMENPKEMGFTRLELAHRIFESYRGAYEGLFGALPPLDDRLRFPDVGKPGDAGFDALSADDKRAIDEVTTNVGKAIEAYLRKLASGASPFDRFLAGDSNALSAKQQLGMLIFVQSGCADCHSGPMLSDEKFHNLGVPAWESVDVDEGRATVTGMAADRGAFRTPSLRNVSVTDPYMHNGRMATLDEAVTFHLGGGGRGGDGFVGEIDPLIVTREVSAGDFDALLAFLAALEGEQAPKPWSDWPDRP
jgi:cytochrome c peroxidase